MLANLYVFLPIFILYFANNYLRFLTHSRYNACSLCISIFFTEVAIVVLYAFGIYFVSLPLFTLMVGMSVISVANLLKGNEKQKNESGFPIKTLMVYLAILIVGLLT